MTDIISEEECLKIVQMTVKSNPESVKIEDYSTEPVSDKILGFLGEYLRLVVRIKLNVSCLQRL